MATSTVNQGYWAPWTASEKWCEPAYAQSPYIVEFWNTVSSLPIVLLSLTALYYGVRGGMPKRLLLPSLLTALVGCGSVWFHGTMAYGGQALDELAMVCACVAFLYCGLEADPRGVKSPWLAPVLLAFSAAFIAAYVYLKETNYFIFFVAVFALLSTRCCYTAYQLYLRTTDRTLRALFFGGQILWASSFLLFWLPDRLFCSTFQPYNLHAVFHVMTAVAATWFNTHNMHCFYTAMYVCKTKGLICNADGSNTPAPPALLEFLKLDIAPEAGAAAAAAAAATTATTATTTTGSSFKLQPVDVPPILLQRPCLAYIGFVGPFVELQAEKYTPKSL